MINRWLAFLITGGRLFVPSGRVEFVDTINEQKPDQTAQSQLATQKPPMSMTQPKKTLTWQTDGTCVIT
jgi:predicted dinucleotide-utilizing enzyme